jgi:hypothetical protein
MKAEVPQVEVGHEFKTKTTSSTLGAGAREKIARACVKAFGNVEKARLFAETQ